MRAAKGGAGLGGLDVVPLLPDDPLPVPPDDVLPLVAAFVLPSVVPVVWLWAVGVTDGLGLGVSSSFDTFTTSSEFFAATSSFCSEVMSGLIFERSFTLASALTRANPSSPRTTSKSAAVTTTTA